MTCLEKVDDVKSKGVNGRPLIGAFTPKCDVTGEYENKQCHGSTGFCWCVDKKTGKEIEGTRTRGKLECGMFEYIFFAL